MILKNLTRLCWYRVSCNVKNEITYQMTESVKNVRIWSHSGPHFPAFGMITEKYFRTFYAVNSKSMEVH